MSAVSAMLEYFTRKRNESIAKAARAEFVVQRTDALAWVEHYNRLIAMTKEAF